MDGIFELMFDGYVCGQKAIEESDKRFAVRIQGIFSPKRNILSRFICVSSAGSRSESSILRLQGQGDAHAEESENKALHESNAGRK